MEANGYNYSEITVDGQVIGTWSKSTQSSTSVETARTIYDKINNDIINRELCHVTCVFTSFTCV